MVGAKARYDLGSPKPELDRSHRAAVILNQNAKRVTERVRKRIARKCSSDVDVFFTDSMEQAEFVVRRVVDSGYQTIVTGGGDGTVVHTIDRVLTHRKRRGFSHCPRFAVLKLGTGNAVADFLGAGSPANDLQSIDDADYRWLDLLSVNGRRTTFGGFGWDAYVLNDYDALRELAEKFGPARYVFKTVGGYLASGIFQSVPKLVAQKLRWHVRIVNTGSVARQLDGAGNTVATFETGEVVYDGTVGMGCFGTTPYYGYKMNIMPFADRTSGMFHLRLLDMHPIEAVVALRQAWSGGLGHKGVSDFELSGCRIEFDGEGPLQVAGDGQGEVKTIKVGIDQPIRCAQFAS